jgi:hypothetical protein
MTAPWDPAFTLRSPMFAPLRACAQALAAAAWPDCARLNHLAAAGAAPPCNAGGMPIRFVPQSPRQNAFENKYEPRIFLRGEVQMRAGNWHDFFNALVWLVFPRAKAALNRRHYEALCAQRAAGVFNRGPQQDALTLFDEGGVVIACAAPELAALLRNHDWKNLFWQRRAELEGAMAFYLFGHALYEKALQPYCGMTGRGIVLDVDADFLRQSPAQQVAALDARLAVWLATAASLVATRELAAVPVLGVPGWCADNGAENYYDNTGYFRPARFSSRRR